MGEDGSSKFDLLGDILGVDDTEEIERPERRRGVGEVLTGRAPQPEPDDEEGAPSKPPEARPIAKPRPLVPASPSTPARSPAATRRRDPRDGVPKQRTSSTVPVEITSRLEEARGRRWSINRVISSAVAQPEMPVERAEELIDRYEGSPRAVCSYRVPVAEIEALDGLADRWRMSRSQVLTVLLDVELERLGY